MFTIAVRLLACVLLLTLSAPAHAFVHYNAYAGFYPGSTIYLNDDDYQPPVAVGGVGQFSYNGAACPAAGTPNFLCASIRATAGRSPGGRLFLGAGASLARTNAQFTQEHGAYGGARIDVFPVNGYTSGPAPGAYFVFGLHGTISSSSSTAGVAVNSFASAELIVGHGGASVQCYGPMGCPPSERRTVKVINWDLAEGLSLVLRSDVKMMNPDLLTGWDGEGVADFYDTLELLSIQLVDENDQPIPGVTLTYSDASGQDIVIPSTPPDPDATATPAPVATATPAVPLPTATPVCASPPCEDCENCVDDDHDGLVDRADADCGSPANGGGMGLADAGAAKAVDKCAKALRKVGAKLTATRLAKLQACVKAVTDCVQLKPGAASCLTSAQAKCTKARSGLAGAETTLTAAIVKVCGEPAVATSALTAATGLGFEAEATACGRRGVAALGNVGDVAECVRRQHACAVERVLGFTVPRAGELLALGGWNPGGDVSCLTAASVGGSAGVATEKQKTLRKCDLTFQKATAKVVGGRAKAVQACEAAVLTCDQTKPGDLGCLDKARAKCGKSLGGIPKLESSFAAAIAKACGGAPLAVADLRAPEGLGVGVLDDDCAALGIASLTTVGDLTNCLERQLACRVDQMLESESPRLVELLHD